MRPYRPYAICIDFDQEKLETETERLGSKAKALSLQLMETVGVAINIGKYAGLPQGATLDVVSVEEPLNFKLRIHWDAKDGERVYFSSTLTSMMEQIKGHCKG